MYFSNFFSRALVAALAALLVTACGGGGGSGPAQSSLPGTPTLDILPSPPAVANQLSVYVDNGPADTGYNVNRLYTDVTICQPGKSSPGSPTQCQTIKHVLVDTGSTGLRLLSSAMAPALNLGRLTESSRGLPLLNCVQFLDDTFGWGPVATADVVLGGMKAASVPIQVIADPAFNSAPAACSGGGTSITTAATLGANGIIGLGLFKQDCPSGSNCPGNVSNGFYYTCTDASCTATTGAKASILQQVTNPVTLFDSNNKNGILIDLPPVSTPGSASLRGTLTFGIGTQDNNRLASAKVLTTNSFGYITTQLAAGQPLTQSFIDTGSNGLYFDTLTIPKCPVPSAGFYCPTSSTALSATLSGASGEPIPAFSFSIDNALTLFAGATNSVLPTLAGDLPGHASSFDWGLPFFYGRRVFIGIEGEASSTGTGSVTGPFYAF